MRIAALAMAALISGPALANQDEEKLAKAVSACWNVGVLSQEAMQTRVVITIPVTDEGRVVGDKLRLGWATGEDAAVSQAFQVGRLAILRCASSGLPIPDGVDMVEFSFSAPTMTVTAKLHRFRVDEI